MVREAFPIGGHVNRSSVYWVDSNNLYAGCCHGEAVADFGPSIAPVGGLVDGSVRGRELAYATNRANLGYVWVNGVHSHAMKVVRARVSHTAPRLPSIRAHVQPIVVCHVEYVRPRGDGNNFHDVVEMLWNQRPGKTRIRRLEHTTHAAGMRSVHLRSYSGWSTSIKD